MNKHNFGFVLVAAGKDHYYQLSARAAARIKFFHPNIPIELYSDRSFHSNFIDANYEVGFEKAAMKQLALIRTKFDRAIYIDSDIFLTAQVDDVFFTLDRFDIALAHDQFPANKYCAIEYGEILPASFPQFNGGFIGIKKSDSLNLFLHDWLESARRHGIGRDQPTLRYCIWKSNLRVATLPPEYNLMNSDLILSKRMNHCHMAPRAIHNPEFYQLFNLYKNRKNPIADSLGPKKYAVLNNLLATDRTLTPGSPPRPAARALKRIYYLLMIATWCVPRIPSSTVFATRYFVHRTLRRWLRSRY